MSGHKNFNRLRAEMAPDSRARAAARTDALRKDMLLHELREAMRLSQVQLGEMLHVEQPAIAKIEKRTDMYVSTLRRFIEAMGGELRIVAKFPQGEVDIGNFSDVKEKPEAAE